jgi:hypothetical protein
MANMVVVDLTLKWLITPSLNVPLNVPNTYWLNDKS